MKKEFKKLILVLILIIAFSLRFYRIWDYPALNADEAALGYNAYSLLLTGKDEHGNPWPLHFQSFDDYKPGFYVYLLLPFVKFFGLNELSIRFPNVLFGSLTILFVYLLLEEIFGKKDVYFPLISSFILAVSPWHIHFSRGAWEVNTSTFLIVLALYFFYKSIRKKRFLFLFIFFLSLSLYTYHSARILVPFILVFLILSNWKGLSIRKYLKIYLVAGLFFTVLTLPLFLAFFKNEKILARARGVGIFADLGPLNRANVQRGEHSKKTMPLAVFLHNKVVNYSLRIFQNYTRHYSGDFLFVSGDEVQRSKIPDMGILHLFEIITLGVGFYLIAKNPKNWGIFLFWFLIGPIPASLTFQSPSALRSQNLTIPFAVVSGYGLAAIVKFFLNMKHFLKYILIVFTLFLVLYFIFYYLHMYYVHMARRYPFSSQYGVKELVLYLKDKRSFYEKFIVTDTYDQPYILFLFYLSYPPQKFQNEHLVSPRDEFGFSTVREFDKFVFTSLKDLEMIKNNFKNVLIVGTPSEIVNDEGLLKRIYGSNGYEYFRVIVD